MVRGVYGERGNLRGVTGMTTPEAKREAHRQLALDLSSKDREEWLELCRREARRVATERGEVSTNELRPLVPDQPRGVDPRAIAGAFRGMKWLRYTKSTWGSRHGGIISVWRLP